MARSETSSLTNTLDRLTDRLEIVAGSVLGEKDKVLVAEALVMRLALLIDLTAGSPGHSSVASWRRTILGLKVLDVESYSSDWKTLREIATSTELRSVYPDPGACKEVFKRLSRGLIHYKWILSITLMLVEGDDWWWRVNQFIVFDSKLNLDSLDLTTACCQDYLEFEQSIPTRGGWRNPDGKGTRALNIARMAAVDLVGQFNVRNYPFRPSHGNGATAELSRSEADWWHKNRHFAVDSDVITYMRYRVPQDDWRDWFYVPYRGLDRRAVVTCVPKSMTGNRTISKEPTTLQYLQQDLFRALDDYFVEALHDRIDLHDQTRSRVLAQAGSAHGDYATIDLSSASDSVSVDLVDAFFDGLPIHYPLIATRSSYVLVEDKARTISETIETKKFAPMGSAVCFPTECMVFAIICETAVRLVTGRRSRVGDYVVYGDDIVIREEYAAECVWALEFFGFTTNLSKSFYGDRDTCSHFFREACGIECFDGADITPLRLSRRLKALTMNDSERQAGEGVGMCDLVNRAYLYHFRTLRRLLTTWLSRYRWFRTCLYISISEYREIQAAIANGKSLPVWVTAPFIITDDASNTNYRAFGARFEMDGLQEYEARVSVAAARRPSTPPTSARAKAVPITTCTRNSTTNTSQTTGRRTRAGVLGDNNDYFSWWISTVTTNNDEDTWCLDAMGIVTLRSPDLKWSKKWVVLNKMARLNRRPITGN